MFGKHCKVDFLSTSPFLFLILTDIWLLFIPCTKPVVSYLSLRTVSKAPANEKKERPLSTMSEASNPMGGSDCAANSSSPAGRVSDTQWDKICWPWPLTWGREQWRANGIRRALYKGLRKMCLMDWSHDASALCLQPSRPSKKIHNFGKRSNSIRRNPSAPVIKRNWLYKQVSCQEIHFLMTASAKVSGYWILQWTSCLFYLMSSLLPKEILFYLHYVSLWGFW